jgi:hypothetical protein
MNGLPTADRTRLVKLLGMCGSEHAGERAAAAAAADRLLRERGLTWADALNPPPVERKLPELGTWRQTVRACLAQPGSLRPWEVGFLRDLPGFQRLSVKQRYCLKEISDRVLGRDAP